MASTVEPLACDAARELARRHLTAALHGREAEQLRAHLAGCSACTEAWTGMVETTAALGHARREVREIDRTARAMARRQMQEEDDGSVQRRTRWRLYLYPAVMALMLWAFRNRLPSVPDVTLEPSAGVVHLSGEQLALDEAHRVVAGQAIEVAADGEATLRLGDASFALGGTTALRLQRRAPLVLELAAGSLDASGPATVQCDAGLLELATGERAEVWVDGMQVRVTGREGRPLWVDAEGEQVVEVGDVLQRGATAPGDR